jgi:hypothetical protein
LSLADANLRANAASAATAAATAAVAAAPITAANSRHCESTFAHDSKGNLVLSNKKIHLINELSRRFKVAWNQQPA